MTIELGIRHDLSNEEYHAMREAISNSYISSWIRSNPYETEYGQGSSVSEQVADYGTGFHALCLEPEKGLVVRHDGENRMGKQWKVAKEKANKEGKVLLLPKEYDAIEAMREALLANDHGGRLLNAKDKVCEASIFVKNEKTGLVLKCRPDIYSEELGVVGDLKSTIDASPRGFGRSIFKYGYNYQAFFYLYVCRLAGLDVDKFAFLAVRKTVPYSVHVHTMHADALAHAEMMIERALEEIAEARETGHYPTNWGNYTVHDLPEYLIED